MGALHTYGKNERLKSRKRIDLLFKEGKRISVPPLLFVYRIHAESGIGNPESALPHPSSAQQHPASGIPQGGISLRSIRNAQSIVPMLQAGVGVRSKQFRHAVDRNRIKRLLRESWRTQKNILRDRVSAGTLNLDVFILYTGTELPAQAHISTRTGEGIGKIMERLLQDRGGHSENQEAR